MLERYDTTELLELIEGDLDHAAADALRSRLAGDAPAGRLVESMMRDRASLRSFEEPALPQDFIAAIEPMLSRPMLIEPVAELATLRPGEFRRQQRRKTRGLRLGRLAAAAVLMLAAVGGTWALIENLGALRRGNGNDALASNGGRNSTNENSANRQRPSRDSSAIAAADVLGPGTVHHDPRPGAGRDAMVAAVGSPPASPDSPPADSSIALTTIAADFVVVLHAASPTAAESSVGGALADLGDRAALVRNFSYAEAQRLSEEYRLAHGASRDSDAVRPADHPMANVAAGANDNRPRGSTGIELQQLAMQVREQLRLRAPAISQAQATDTAAAPSSSNDDLIAGAQAVAPSLEQQLDFSSRGATHTIAVPASELIALVEKLALGDPATGSTSLHMLPAGGALGTTPADAIAGTPSPAATTLSWLTEGPRVRQALQRLSQTRGDTIVLLPVTVQ